MQLKLHIASVLLSALLVQAATIGSSLTVAYSKDIHLGDPAIIVSGGINHPFYTLSTFITAPNGTVKILDQSGSGFRAESSINTVYGAQNTNADSTCAAMTQWVAGEAWLPDVVGSDWTYSFNVTLFYSANNTYTTKTINGQKSACMSKPFKTESLSTGPHKFAVHAVGEALPSPTGIFTAVTVSNTVFPSALPTSTTDSSLTVSTSLPTTPGGASSVVPSGTDLSSTDAVSLTATSTDAPVSPTDAAPSPSDSSTASAALALKSGSSDVALMARSLFKRDSVVSILEEEWKWSPVPTGQAFLVSGAYASRATSFASCGAAALGVAAYLWFA